MIQLKMFGEKWRMTIGDETWEFPTTKEFKETLDKILKIKEKYGKIKRCQEAKKR